MIECGFFHLQDQTIGQINVSAFDGAKKPEEDVNFKKTFPIFINT
jgi:hypothetical protein